MPFWGTPARARGEAWCTYVCLCMYIYIYIHI